MKPTNDRKRARWLAAWLALGLSGSLAASGEPLKLTPFYRATQLQGHLFGLGLANIPAYLLAPDIAFPYKLNPRLKEEIPFVDTFTIVRFIGGYREDWLARFNLIQPELGRRSLDYAIKGADGAWTFRPELLKARLRPYLEAGYSPADITLSLDNPPWDAATPDGAPPKMGPWGRKTPPGDLNEWAMIVRRLAADLKTLLGEDAAKLSFETGVEFDQRESFDGDAAAFFQYYKTTVDAVHAALPKARINPGEFTRNGMCARDDATCVYDTKDFLEFADRERLAPPYVPRSLNDLLDHGNPSPDVAARRFNDSYARLPSVIEEIHQFGILSEPFGDTFQNDPGPRQAAWEFETIAGILAKSRPRRIFHWGGFVQVGKMEYLNGSGFLRLAWDHYLGRDALILPATDATASDRSTRVGAMALSDETSTALMVASFSAGAAGGERDVTVTLPPELHFAEAGLKVVTLKASTNIFATIRRDLEADGNLKSEFAGCPTCLGTPVAMGADLDKTRQMLIRDWPRYQDELRAGLRWRPANGEAAVHGRVVTVRLEANELLILE
jgi:hypothetical protein